MMNSLISIKTLDNFSESTRLSSQLDLITNNNLLLRRITTKIFFQVHKSNHAINQLLQQRIYLQKQKPPFY